MLWESRHQVRFDEFNLRLLPASWAAIASINAFHFITHDSAVPRLLDAVVVGIFLVAILVHRFRPVRSDHAGAVLLASLLLVAVKCHRAPIDAGREHAIYVGCACCVCSIHAGSTEPLCCVCCGDMVRRDWHSIGALRSKSAVVVLNVHGDARKLRGIFARRYSQHQLETTKDELATSLEQSQDALEESERLRGELERQERQLRVIAENMADVVYIYDAHGVIRYVSDSVTPLLGFTPEERIGLSYKESSMTPESIELVAPIMERALAGDLDHGQIEIQHRRKDGQLVWTETRGSAIRSASGEVEGVCVVVRDITARRAAETKLRESEASYRGLTERSIDPILSFDRTGRITYASPSAETIWDVRPEDLIGQRHDVGQTQQSRERAALAFDRLSRGETSQEDIEVEHELADGRRVWSELRVWPIIKADAFSGFQFIARDITERKETSEQLERQQKRLSERTRELAELNKQLDNFAATVTHDLQAPVRRLIRQLDAKETEPLSQVEIKQQVEAIADLVEHLLVTTTYRDSLIRTTIDLSVTVRRLVAQQTLDTGRTCELGLPEVGEALVNADAKLIDLLLGNLISNAFKFTPTDRMLELRLELTQDHQHVPSVRLTDNGDGFPVEDPSVLFDFAARADSEQEGFGVGLTTAESIVRRHGGEITLRNMPTGGACVSFSLGEDSRYIERTDY